MEEKPEALRLADLIGGNAAAELRRLHEVNADLLAALRELVEVHDEPCRIDHNGRCQSHFLDDVNNGGCRVATARAAIAKATGETDEDTH